MQNEQRKTDASRINTPAVSIIMPAYNAESFLERAVQSVVAQTCNNWQLIIINDGSTDGTLALALSFAEHDNRIIVLNQDNAGTANAINAGIATTRTPWFACVDADDELESSWAGSLEEATREHPGKAMYGSNLRVLSLEHPKGKPCYNVINQTTVNLIDFLTHQYFQNSGAWTDRELWERMGGFSDTSYSEDYDFIVRALLIKDAWYLPETLYIYHTEHTGRKSDALFRQSTAVIETCVNLINQHYDKLDGATLHAACQQINKRANTIERLNPQSAAFIISELKKAQAQALICDAERHANRFSSRFQRSLYHLACALIGEGRAQKYKIQT